MDIKHRNKKLQIFSSLSFSKISCYNIFANCFEHPVHHLHAMLSKFIYIVDKSLTIKYQSETNSPIHLFLFVSLKSLR